VFFIECLLTLVRTLGTQALLHAMESTVQDKIDHLSTQLSGEFKDHIAKLQARHRALGCDCSTKGDGKELLDKLRVCTLVCASLSCLRVCTFVAESLLLSIIFGKKDQNVRTIYMSL
jgi:hypothetical protein